ncbi:MAG TPA: sulfatase [Thermoanaerobaculia bacterium]
MPKGPPPNVLVISVCSIRADHVSFNGYRRDTMPNLAKLAADSVIFDRAMTQWPKTVPAVSALLTGRYGHSTGVMRSTIGQHLADEEVTIGEHFRDHGYSTAAFISSSALHAANNLFQQGFDRVEETYREPKPYAATTSRALQWVKKQKRPFFLWVHYNNAHQPYLAPDAPPNLFVDDQFYDKTVRIPLNENDEMDLDVPKDHPFRMQIVRADMNGVRREARLKERPDELAFYVARYDAGIYGADRRIGELLDGLKPLLEKTIVVFVGDHGEALGEQGYYFGHGRLPYDAVVHVPLMIKPLGGGKGRHVSQPVPSFSLFPTLAEMAGLPEPKTAESPSLAPLVRNDGPAPQHVFGEAGYAIEFQTAVRDARWKLIRVPDPIDRQLMTGSEFELYDMNADPGETKNVFTQHPDEARRLQKVLLNWTRTWRDKPHGAKSQPQNIDPETEKQLRALGYIQ